MLQHVLPIDLLLALVVALAGSCDQQPQQQADSCLIVLQHRDGNPARGAVAIGMQDGTVVSREVVDEYGKANISPIANETVIVGATPLPFSSKVTSGSIEVPRGDILCGELHWNSGYKGMIRASLDLGEIASSEHLRATRALATGDQTDNGLWIASGQPFRIGGLPAKWSGVLRLSNGFSCLSEEPLFLTQESRSKESVLAGRRLLVGQVVNQSGNPVPMARGLVRVIYETGEQQSRTVLTDESGYFASILGKGHGGEASIAIFDALNGLYSKPKALRFDKSGEFVDADTIRVYQCLEKYVYVIDEECLPIEHPRILVNTPLGGVSFEGDKSGLCRFFVIPHDACFWIAARGYTTAFRESVVDRCTNVVLQKSRLLLVDITAPNPDGLRVIVIGSRDCWQRFPNQAALDQGAPVRSQSSFVGRKATLQFQLSEVSNRSPLMFFGDSLEEAFILRLVDADMQTLCEKNVALGPDEWRTITLHPE